MKVHVFESENWIKSAWQNDEIHLDSIWVEGLLTQEVARQYRDAQIISIDVSVLNKPILQEFHRLKLIALRSTGSDQVDLNYCEAHQITVGNVPVYAQHAVAEQVFALAVTVFTQAAVLAFGGLKIIRQFVADGLVATAAEKKVQIFISA